MRSCLFGEIVKMKGSGTCLPLALIFATLFACYSSGSQDMNRPTSSRTVDEQCVDNLQRIYKLLKQYLHHSGGALGFPSNLDALYPMAKDPQPFICPADKELETATKLDSFRTSYEIVNNPLEAKFKALPAKSIAIVIEKKANHEGQRFVLFYDGSVRTFDDRGFKTLRDHAFIEERSTDTAR